MEYLNMIKDNLGTFGVSAGGLTMGGVALYLLNRIPNDKLSGLVYDACMHLGEVCTLGLGRWKATKDIWNQYIEPWFIDILDNLVASAINGFIKGLRSDNSKGK